MAKAAAAGNGVAGRRTDVLYKEYVRLSALQHGYIKSSFDDFKMLSAVGSVVGLVITIASFLTKGRKQADILAAEELGQLAFVAFLGMLALVAILAFRDLLKQSLIGGLTVHLAELEQLLRKRMKLEATHVLLASTMASTWVATQHRQVAIVFHIVFYAALGGIPFAVLHQLGAPSLGQAYASVAGAAFVVHLLAAGLTSGFTAAKLKAAHGLPSGSSPSAGVPTSTTAPGGKS